MTIESLTLLKPECHPELCLDITLGKLSALAASERVHGLIMRFSKRVFDSGQCHQEGRRSQYLVLVVAVEVCVFI